MKAVIVGAGAIGGWMAGLLSEASWDVGTLARGQTLANIKSHGLVVRRGANEKSHRLVAGDDPAKFEQPDFVIIAVKAQNLPDAAPTVAALCGPQTAIVPALNGIPWWFFAVRGVPLEGTSLLSVDPRGNIGRLLEIRRVVGCVVHASASVVSPGVIEVAGEDKLIFGEPDGKTSARVVALCDTVARAGVTSIASDNIRRDIWTKLWGNMTMNPLSALTGATTGELLRNDETRALVRSMMLEMQAIGTRIGLPLAMTPEARMEITRKLGDFKTSMLRDAEAGRALEIGPILGALVEIADRLSEPAPFLRAVHGLMRVRSGRA
jgi:2-dehydropantoate 2-reductase